MVSSTDKAGLYRASRERISAAARTFDDAALATVVPACPIWTVHGLLSHLVGVTGDFMADNFDDAPSDEWTARQVAARADRSVEELLAEWQTNAQAVDESVARGDHPNWFANNPYIDSSVHEADLHGAIGTGRPERAAWLATTAIVAVPMDKRLQGVGELTIVTEEGSSTVGSGEAKNTVEVDSYELFRARFGRRSAAQVTLWAWASDPTPFLPYISAFQQTETDLQD